jgi:amidase
VPLHGPPIRGPVRVAVTIDPAGQGVDPDVAAGVRRAADALARAGYAVEEVEPPAIAEGGELWARLVATEIKMTMMPLIEQACSPDTLRFWRHIFEVVPVLDYTAYVQAFAKRSELARAWSLFQAEWPLVLGPVSTLQAPPVGFDLTGPDAVAALFQAQRLVVLVNLLGLPAAAVPAGTAHGLPQGVQIIGARYREDLCLDAAQAVEDQLGVLTPIDPRGEAAWDDNLGVQASQLLTATP